MSCPVVSCRVASNGCGQNLISHGADVEARNALDRTPLMSAAMAGHVGALRMLLDNGERERETRGRTDGRTVASRVSPYLVPCLGGRETRAGGGGGVRSSVVATAPSPPPHCMLEAVVFVC